MHNTITNRQLSFLILVTLITYNLLTIPYSAAQLSGRGGWIPILINTVFFALFSLFITKLNLMYKGRIFFDYTKDILGKAVCKILIIYYMLYFFTVFLYLACHLFTILEEYFLPESPVWATSLLALTVFAMITTKGITNIARLFELIGPTLVIFSLLIYGLAFTQGIKYNLLPLFDAERIGDYLKGTKDIIIPFLGVETLFIIPFTKKNLKAPKIAFFSIIFVGIYYTLTFLSILNVMGLSNLLYYKTPVLEGLRLVRIPVLERVDILYLIFGFIGLFLGIVIVFSAIAEPLCQLIPKANRSFLIMAIGALTYIICLFIHNISNLDDIMNNIVLYSGILSAVIIPALVFFIAKVKKDGQKTV